MLVVHYYVLVWVSYIEILICFWYTGVRIKLTKTILRHIRRTFANRWWAYVSVGMRRPSIHFWIPASLSLALSFLFIWNLLSAQRYDYSAPYVHIYPFDTYHHNKNTNKHHQLNDRESEPRTYTYTVHVYTVLYNYCGVIITYFQQTHNLWFASLYRQLSCIYIYIFTHMPYVRTHHKYWWC